MDKILPSINSEEEASKIKSFIKGVLSKEKMENVVIGISSGVDSTACLYLLRDSLPAENIYAIHLPYFEEKSSDLEEAFAQANLANDHKINFSIKPIVDFMFAELNIPEDDIRRGNVMARIRMIILYDFSKKFDALVCGTENRSENLLGYFTRFGDEASDFEPILHLYKTQVYELAKHLGVPQSIIEKPPSANLWENQTDEGEFGFSYLEADPVLYLYFDKKKPIEEIEKMNLPNAGKIINFAKKNHYKRHTPFHL
ncbi:MAG: NH(3)-dependent NAD(+) synthetase [Candidatus Levybacteria bacterium GW2011_GWA2_40_8]|nr:MAG: NH(3)-dependent NAD(+) synthetase [Candidatus Levybacteria bacterium GW2011_GWA2_40_8]